MFQGTCLCGAVAFEADQIMDFRYCQCSRCRKATGSAFASNIFVKPEGFRWQRGEDQISKYKVPTAQRFLNAFCRNCGSRVPQTIAALGLILIPAGTLDTDPGARPRCHIFVGSKAPWHEITDNLPHHQEYDPS